MQPLRVGLIGYDGVQGLDIVGPSDAFTIPTVPVGVTFVPFASVSVTVTLAVLAWFTSTVDGARLTLVDVDRALTVRVLVSVLIE